VQTFFWYRQASRFREKFQKVVKSCRLADDSGSDYGTHSFRKGAVTYCTSGVNGGPNPISVCIRAGWTISGAKEAYMKWYVDNFTFLLPTFYFHISNLQYTHI
jgi:hypothetical protein